MPLGTTGFARCDCIRGCASEMDPTNIHYILAHSIDVQELTMHMAEKVTGLTTLRLPLWLETALEYHDRSPSIAFQG